MNKLSFCSSLVMLIIVSFGFSGAALGDTAQVLPKGVSAVSAIYYHYSDIDERYDPDGNVEDIAIDLYYNYDFLGWAYELKGDEVNKGDSLLVYEAMKMENKLTADKGGIIKSILVKPGDSVLQEDVLLEMELT